MRFDFTSMWIEPIKSLLRQSVLTRHKVVGIHLAYIITKVNEFLSSSNKQISDLLSYLINPIEFGQKSDQFTNLVKT